MYAALRKSCNNYVIAIAVGATAFEKFKASAQLAFGLQVLISDYAIATSDETGLSGDVFRV
jgi:hypothetical protein